MSNGGMIGFKDDLPPTEIEAIRAFMIDRAQARLGLRRLRLKRRSDRVGER